MRPFTFRRAFVGLLAGLAMVTGACAPDAPSGDTGTVGLQLQVAPGVSINTLGWSVTNAGSGFTRAGTVNEQFANTIRFQVGGLPAAAGYVISLSANSTDGAFACTGSAPFAITAGTTIQAGVVLVCNANGNGTGTVVINGSTAVCANITAISVLPLETTVNQPISLSATALAGAIAPMYAWTATAGTFDNPASASPIFTCPATPGTVTITVSVSPNGPGCSSTTSQSFDVTCDTLNPTFTNVYANVIGARCTGCHRPGGSGVTAGTLDLSTAAAAFANLVGVAGAGTGAGTSGITCASLSPAMPRVSPTDVAASLLFNKVNSKLGGTLPACGSPMPPGNAAALTAAQVNLVGAWITAGALNN